MVHFISPMLTLQFSEHLIIIEPLSNKSDPVGNFQRRVENSHIHGNRRTAGNKLLPEQRLSAFVVYGAHELVTNVRWHTRNYRF